LKVFADTSALYAALVKNDRMHDRAATILRKLIASGDELHTTSYVVAETHALLQSRSGLEAVVRFEHVIKPELAVRWVDADLHARAARRLIAIGQRSVGIVDCTSFELMTQLEIPTAFSFDGHFAEQGFALLEG
jgi:predicted nucleic acid-binding protein